MRLFTYVHWKHSHEKHKIKNQPLRSENVKRLNAICWLPRLMSCRCCVHLCVARFRCLRNWCFTLLLHANKHNRMLTLHICGDRLLRWLPTSRLVMVRGAACEMGLKHRRITPYGDGYYIFVDGDVEQYNVCLHLCGSLPHRPHYGQHAHSCIVAYHALADTYQASCVMISDFVCHRAIPTVHRTHTCLATAPTVTTAMATATQSHTIHMWRSDDFQWIENRIVLGRTLERRRIYVADEKVFPAHDYACCSLSDAVWWRRLLRDDFGMYADDAIGASPAIRKESSHKYEPYECDRCWCW